MNRALSILLLGLAVQFLCAGCGTGPSAGNVTNPDIETSFALTNFSTQFYAVFGLREGNPADPQQPFTTTPLLAPGATYRQQFLETIGTGCPATLDVRLWLYRRINDDLPIGLDAGEAVADTPIVAGQISGLPACSTQPLEPYTIVNWDAPPGTALVKIAQGTPIDQAIFETGLFDNVDNVWEIFNLDPALADMPPPALAQTETVSGRVTQIDGSGLEGIGVMIRTRFRVRLNDDDPDNDPDAGFGEPIDFTETDVTGQFAFDRPPGAYRIEFFSDDFSFRPATIDVESPLDVILTVAEPL